MIQHTTRAEQARITMRMEACRCARGSAFPHARVLSDATVLGILSRVGVLTSVEIARNFRHPGEQVRLQLQRLRDEGRVGLDDGRWTLTDREARRQMIAGAR